MQSTILRMQLGSVILVLLLSLSAAASNDGLTFHNTVSGKVLDVRLAPGEAATAAVEHFHNTGKNPYVGNADAAMQGNELFVNNCMICHGPRGVGKMGPNLVDDRYLYASNRTDKGLFESIYGGTVNLMVGWKDRLTQDDILKIIAYLRSLQRK